MIALGGIFGRLICFFRGHQVIVGGVRKHPNMIGWVLAQRVCDRCGKDLGEICGITLGTRANPSEFDDSDEVIQ